MSESTCWAGKTCRDAVTLTLRLSLSGSSWPCIHEVTAGSFSSSFVSSPTPSLSTCVCLRKCNAVWNPTVSTVTGPKCQKGRAKVRGENSDQSRADAAAALSCCCQAAALRHLHVTDFYVWCFGANLKSSSFLLGWNRVFKRIKWHSWHSSVVVTFPFVPDYEGKCWCFTFRHKRVKVTAWITSASDDKNIRQNISEYVTHWFVLLKLGWIYIINVRRDFIRTIWALKNGV